MARLTPRNLEKMDDDQCYYVPVAIKHSEERWWISTADSDLLFWVKGLAVGAGLDVRVFELDVSPLAVQGPKADNLMDRVFREDVHDIRLQPTILPYIDLNVIFGVYIDACRI